MNRSFWITLAIVNLCIVALLGMILRTKFLFPIPFIDYKNLLSAHSHFAFGGWVTLIVMVLLIDKFLLPVQKQKKAYQMLLWSIQLCSTGMLLSFPFEGYGLFSIIFSTLFIFVTYIFSWIFIKDIRKVQKEKSVLLLIISSLLSLVISSVGPFSLAYMMATGSGSATSFRDAIYVFLHFQYNGFFTLAVFALFFGNKISQPGPKSKYNIYWFSLALCLSVLPSFFLSLLWHSYNPVIYLLSCIGCGLIVLTLFFFFRLIYRHVKIFVYRNLLAKALLTFSMISFVLKMILQTGTIIPELGSAVFGYRPIIIGFLHLVFLGMVTFFIFSYLIETGLFAVGSRSARFSVRYFSMAVIANETILLVNGIGLMFENTNSIYGWLLWLASILLFTGACLIAAARIRTGKNLQQLQAFDLQEAIHEGR